MSGLDELLPVVLYRTDRPHRIQLMSCAYVFPLKHPSEYVTGDGETPVLTSTVLWHDHETGQFRTYNTHYMPTEGAGGWHE